MNFWQLAATSVFSVIFGGLMSAILMRSDRKYSVHDLEESALVAVIMVITATSLGFALTYLAGADTWAIRFQGLYAIGLTALGFLAEDWLEGQIADRDPLKNQRVIRRRPN